MTPNDEQQLDLLNKLHYAAAALVTPLLLFGALESAIGIGVVLGKVPRLTPPSAGPSFGWGWVGMGLFFCLIGGAIGGANLLTARSLRSRTRRKLCLLVASVDCLYFPLGTLLGAFTISVLRRPAVRAAFEATKEPRPGQSGPPPHLQTESPARLPPRPLPK